MGSIRRCALLSIVLAFTIGVVACSDRNPAGLEVARAPIDPLVFHDDYGPDVYFQAFFGTHVTAVELDSVYAYAGYAPDGARSLKVNIPPRGSALGASSGGVLTAVTGRDLADFDALSFYARADSGISLDVVGFGNDNTGRSIFDVSMGGLSVTPEWKRFLVPIPAASKLISERGLFLFAEGLEQKYPLGYNIWFDEIRFVRQDDLEVFGSQLPSSRRHYFTGTKAPIGRVRTIFTYNEQFLIVDHGASYYDFAVTDPAVAFVDQRGQIDVRGVGESSITAKLEGFDAFGKIIVTGFKPPSVAAPNPTQAKESVISLFSDVYDDVPIDSWRADWVGVTTILSDYVVAGNPVKMYSTLNRVGIEFFHPLIDASAMQYLHLDVYAPAGTEFEVKLVSFTEDLSDFAESSPTKFDANSSTPFKAREWSSLEISLSDLDVPPTWDWSRVGQLVLASSDVKLLLVDNVYLHQ